MYRTLSIQVTDAVSYGVEPSKGHVQDIAELVWHKIPIEEVLRRLQSDETRGLNEAEAQLRLKRNGKNVLSPPPTHHFRKM